MVYRSTHHHAVVYHAGDSILYNDQPGIVTKAGYKFGSVDIEVCGIEIELGPYDEVWPEKVFA